MISNKTILSLEFDKIKNLISKYTVLNETKVLLDNFTPQTDYLSCKFLLDKTNEAYLFLFKYGINVIEYFDEINDELNRSKKASVLSMGELLKIAKLLRSSRIASTSILNLNATEIIILKNIANSIFYDFNLENSIFTKIINENTIADNASTKLYEIRQQIRVLNEKIREKLSNYIRQGANKYLQDNIVSVRNGRYVVPVKSEHLNNVKGFIHDRSQSGSTFFVEPQEVLELNNELKTATLNENAEIEKILSELTQSVSLIADNLTENIVLLSDLDLSFAKAKYSYKTKSVYPKLNANGIIKIKNGRHPLIEIDKVIPISIELGNKYNYILISGPNTGGKTVTLKLVGLFTLMAMGGVFIPASEESEISVFENVFVDIGDEQSIEQNLSTFSSHIKNIISIVENTTNKSLVLIDELGAGTDPEEGSALAMAITKELVEKKSYGIITTHYSSLKEFAINRTDIINASMDFDSQTYAPLYRIRIGQPGLSNAIEIARRLGLSKQLIDSAKSNLSNEKRNFDNILQNAEKVRSEAELLKNEILVLKDKEEKIYNELNKSKLKFEKEKENFLLKAKTEARKLVNDRLETAENLLFEMKEIFNKAEYTQSDLVKMSTLKNKIENEKYYVENKDKVVSIYEKVDINKLKVGDIVFLNNLNTDGEVLEINLKNKTVWVLVGSLRINAKIKDVSFICKNSIKNNTTVTIKKNNSFEAVKTEINVIGLDSNEALIEVEAFIDKAIINNLEQVRIVHGKGLKILSTAIHNYLKGHKHVSSYRFGKYGEGEHGVTIVNFNKN